MAFLLPPGANPLAAAVASTVEEARAGDQVAMALLMKTRDMASQGASPRAKETFRLMTAYVNEHPMGGATMGAASAAGTRGSSRPIITPPASIVAGTGAGAGAGAGLGRGNQYETGAGTGTGTGTGAGASVGAAAFGIDSAFPTRPLLVTRPSNVQDLPVVAEAIAPKRGALLVFAIWISRGPRITNAHLEDVFEAAGEYTGGERLAEGIWEGWKKPRLPGSTPVDALFGTGHFLGSALREGWTIQGVRSGDLPVKAWAPHVAWELGE